MKRNLILLASMLCAIVSAESCGIIDAALQIKNETKYECAAVQLEDGTVMEGSVILPNGNTKTLNFKDSEGTKHKIASSDIESLCVWKDGHEDNKHILIYKEYLWYSNKKKGDVFNKAWMTPMAAGDHLLIMICAGDYHFKADGNLLMIDDMLPYYAFKEGSSYGTHIASEGLSKANARKNLVEFLYDDPDLCRDIEEKAIDPFDFEAICDAYDPKR